MAGHAWEIWKSGATRQDFDALFRKAEHEGKGLRGGKPDFREEDSGLVVVIDGDNDAFISVSAAAGWTAQIVGSEG